MKVKFQTLFSKNWFTFPLSIEWNNDLVEYLWPAKRLSISFLWWHCAWTFFSERRADNEQRAD